MEWALGECVEEYGFELKEGERRWMEWGESWSREEDGEKCVWGKCKGKLEVEGRKGEKGMCCRYLSVVWEGKGVEVMGGFEMKGY